MMNKDDGKSMGIGLVGAPGVSNMPEAAEAAVETSNVKKLVEGKLLYGGKAQKKARRPQEQRRKCEALKLNRYHQGVNLYVKYLDYTIDDERLRKEFSPFGTITSAKVMTEEGRSKGFGFVCFSSPEEATKAVAEMSGRIVGKKPLYVALAQSREDRRAQSILQYKQRMADIGMRLGPYRYTGGSFIPTMPALPRRFYDAAQVAPIRNSPRWPAQAQVRLGAQVAPIRNSPRRPAQAPVRLEAQVAPAA